MKADFSSLFVKLGDYLVPISAIKGFRTSYGEVIVDFKDGYVLDNGFKSLCCHEFRSLDAAQRKINDAIVTAIKDSNAKA